MDKLPGIILLAFKYPPFSGVGAFRWANLSSKLAKRGHVVHVVTARWNRRKDSSFLHVLNAPLIHIHVVPSLVPHQFENMDSPSTVLRFVVRVIRRIIRILYNPITFIDTAQQWHWCMVPYVRNLIKSEGIKTLIATGSPFSVMTAAAAVKEQLGVDLRVILDYRDPWNDLPVYKSGLGSEKRRRISEEMERKALSGADAIVTVTQGIARMLEKRSGKTVQVIYNGYPGSFQPKIKKEGPNPDNRRLVYAGSFAHGRDEAFVRFLEMAKDTGALQRFDIVVYGQSTPKIDTFIRQTNLGIQFKARLRHDELLNELSSADLGLHLNGSKSLDALSTKIFDYLSIGLPVLSVNYGDEIHGFIINNGFGYSIPINDGPTARKEIARSAFEAIVEIDSEAVKRFSYENLAAEYVKIIEGHGS